LGKKFIPYKISIVENGLSGATLASLSAEEVESSLTEIGVISSLHKKAIITEIKRLQTLQKKEIIETQIQKTSKKSKSTVLSKLPKGFEVNDCVTVPPRDTFDELFKIQGMSYNVAKEMTECETNLQQIAELISASGCDGVNEYDCFISYRVASDVDVAEALYNYLKSKNIQPFWDKKCLTPGLPWKQGFMQGKVMRCLHNYVLCACM
jgi:hypothetical protein